MTRHSDDLRMRHMLEYSRKALAMINGRNRKDLDEDEMLCLALTRVAEIIGEAATRVSGASQDTYGQIPWTEIVGLRNRLVHGYDAVDLDILWDIIQTDLSSLVETLEEIVGDER